MLEKIRNLKNKKGFTLVELIVVLVILAILAALLVPALTGYIDKANQEKVIAECRSVVVAAQTTVSEYYGLNKDPAGADKTAALAQIKTLAEDPGTWKYEIEYGTVNGEQNVVSKVEFSDGKASVTYTKNKTNGAADFSTVSNSVKVTGDNSITNVTSSGSTQPTNPSGNGGSGN